MNAEFTGKVRAYTDRSGTKKDGTNFTAWQIVLDEEVDRYPDSLVADYYGEKLMPPEVNSVVNVGYHVRSSEWNGKFFGQNNIWKIDLIESAPKDGSGATPQQAVVDPLAAAASDAIGETDPKSGLPF